MKYLSLFIVLIALVSCVDKRQQELDLIKVAEDKAFEDITAPVSMEIADDIIAIYSSFVNDFPEDSLAPKFLFKTAEVYMNTDRPREAISILDTLIENYSDSKLLPQAMHLKGFIWDDRIHSAEMARICFEQLIKRFPDHDLSKNAEDYLKILGKSPEEIIQQFEESNKE